MPRPQTLSTPRAVMCVVGTLLTFAFTAAAVAVMARTPLAVSGAIMAAGVVLLTPTLATWWTVRQTGSPTTVPHVVLDAVDALGWSRRIVVYTLLVLLAINVVVLATAVLSGPRVG